MGILRHMFTYSCPSGVPALEDAGRRKQGHGKGEPRQTVQPREAGDGTRIYDYVSEIEFRADNQVFHTYGPGNMEYDIGREITIYYRPGGSR